MRVSAKADAMVVLMAAWLADILVESLDEKEVELMGKKEAAY